MKKNDVEQKFFLAFQKRPGDAKFIDVSKLRIANGYNPSSLALLDSFTMYFTKEEIIKAVEESNLIEDSYLNGDLVVLDNQGHKPLTVLDKVYLDGFNLTEFLTNLLKNQSNPQNKQLLNHIAYKFKEMIKDNDGLVANFDLGLKTGNIDLLINTILSTEYCIQRKYMIYLIDLNRKEKEKSLLNNDVERIRDNKAA